MSLEATVGEVLRERLGDALEVVLTEAREDQLVLTRPDTGESLLSLQSKEPELLLPLNEGRNVLVSEVVVFGARWIGPSPGASLRVCMI